MAACDRLRRCRRAAPTSPAMRQQASQGRLSGRGVQRVASRAAGSSTCWTIEALLGAAVAVPLKAAVIVCLPAVSDDVVNAARPASSGTTASTMSPSLIVSVPPSGTGARAAHLASRPARRLGRRHRRHGRCDPGRSSSPGCTEHSSSSRTDRHSPNGSSAWPTSAHNSG